MRKRDSWITMAIVNLCLVAFAGMALRTKFLFPLPFIDYRNLLSAHSHFAFGGWVTLMVMVLFIDRLLTPELKQKRIYQVLLWGIQINSLGMLLTFPFDGYNMVTIFFSTAFIFFTYAFSWVFIRDLRKTPLESPLRILAICSLLCLVISSAGPFSLAYMMATKSGTADSFRDAIYSYLHFQYNGFFTLAVFALLFNRKIKLLTRGGRKDIQRFVVILCLSIIPSLFLSLLWHHFNAYITNMAWVGFFLVLLTFFSFLVLVKRQRTIFTSHHRLAGGLLLLSMASFAIKTILQTGTIIPSLGNAVFGYRPIIIGFLHLVFLGLVTFYILAHLIEAGHYTVTAGFSRFALLFFSMAIILNETILLVDGIGLMFKRTDPIYGWLLWVASILLFTGALLMVIARSKMKRMELASG